MAHSINKMHADHFENVAQYYGEFRPKYPLRFFETIAQKAPSRQHCWDCATGSGQAAVAPAESSGLRAQSVDLIMVAQALRWFPLDAFFLECQRVLKPCGILAIWTYGQLTTNEETLDQ